MPCPHLTSVHSVRCSAALCSLSPPRPRLLLTGEWKLWTPWVTSTPQLVIYTPSPVLWHAHCYDMTSLWLWYDNMTRLWYEIWDMTALPICAALRQCCERTAVCCTSHHTDATRHFYCTPPSPSPALYTRGWNVNHLQPFGCSALFMLSTLTSTLTPVIISSVDIQKV